MLRLENLTVGYGQRVLISSANVEFGAGRLTALIGRNGAGKSSLLRVVAGIDPPLSGQVLIDGASVATMPPSQRARAISFVTTQRVRIAHLRCEDVVGLGRAPYTDWMGHLSRRDREIVAESLALVGMETYAHRTMDTMSDGECQRVMIARALAQDTPVILLDEPTSFLDLPNRYDLCSLLGRLAHQKRKTILFSTHELDIALGLCDDIALIASPRLILLAAREMARSGEIERLFTNSDEALDVVERQIRLFS